MQFYIDVAIGVAGTLVVQKSWSVLSGFFSTAKTDAAAVAANAQSVATAARVDATAVANVAKKL